MDFAFTEEQEMLRDQVRSWLAAECPAERVAELGESKAGWDESSWPKMAELGWTGLSIPEEHGGAGMGFLDEAVVFEELGYRLYPGPYLSTVALAVPALQAAPDVLVAVAEGRARATLAAAEAEPSGSRGAGLGDGDDPTTSAERDGDAWTITGIKEPVVDLQLATHVVVSAATAEGVGLWLVEPSPDAVTPLETVDSTRRLGRLNLEAHPATALIEPGGARATLGHIRRRIDAALALEAVGVAQRVLELARDYASERTQFDKPIGSFQAVSHQIADIYMGTELARSLAYWAAWSVAESQADAKRAAAAARSMATGVAVSACEASIQVHGGIGFTWEHVLHRYYKRALGNAAFNGSPATGRATVAASLLDQ
ncbi:MAG: acyl-CoA dehydrogenase family protein [Actinomycetota bacterium]